MLLIRLLVVTVFLTHGILSIYDPTTVGQSHTTRYTLLKSYTGSKHLPDPFKV